MLWIPSTGWSERKASERQKIEKLAKRNNSIKYRNQKNTSKKNTKRRTITRRTRREEGDKTKYFGIGAGGSKW